MILFKRVRGCSVIIAHYLVMMLRQNITQKEANVERKEQYIISI